MIITFNTETITSRKWIMMMTLIPTLITDVILVTCNKLAWCFWGIYSEINLDDNLEYFQKIDSQTPHLPILSLGIIMLLSILLAYVIFYCLIKTHKCINKKTIKYFNIIIIIKTFFICSLMYIMWNSANVDLTDSIYWSDTFLSIGRTVAMILPLFYIPIIVLICKNKDKI